MCAQKSHLQKKNWRKEGSWRRETDREGGREKGREGRCCVFVRMDSAVTGVCVQVGKKDLLLSVFISYLGRLDPAEERFSALPCASLFCFRAAK